MPVLRFDPFRDLDRLTEQMLGAPAGSPRVPRFMPMDLFRSGDHFVLTADLPGMDPGSIDVSVDNGTLTIRAERTARSDDSGQWLASERFTGSFMRQISLGEGIDTNGISATYDNGVLSLMIPLAEVTKPRRIEVQASRSSTVIPAQVQSAQPQSAQPQSASVESG